MSSLAQSQTYNMPAPTMGIDWSVPKEQVQYPYTPASLDWIADGNRVVTRPFHEDLTDLDYDTMASYEAGSALLANVPSGGSPGIYSYNTTTNTSTRIHVASLPFRKGCNYQNRIFLATAAGAASWDGATFNATAFTGASGGSSLPGCCIYRDRYIQVQAQAMFFAPIAGGLSGVLSTFNLASYGSTGEFISCSPITINDSNNLSDYLVLVSTGGDILAFTGDFPGSANWQLVVKTKVPILTGFYHQLVPYSGDAYLMVSYPPAFFSLKTLIEAGRVEAERSSPLAKQLNFIKSAFNTSLLNAVFFPRKNAFLIEAYMDQSYIELLFGFTPPSLIRIWFYIDINSGAVSPFSYPDYSTPSSDPNTKGTTISHVDGYVYTITALDGKLWKLFDEDTQTNTEVNINTFLQFPYTNLEMANSVKNLQMAFVIMSRYDGYVEAELAIETDYDPNQIGVFTSPDGALDSGNQQTKRLIIPISGSGSEISVALINDHRPKLSCQSISLQFEQGGPY